MKSIKMLLTSKTESHKRDIGFQNQVVKDQATHIVKRCIACKKCTKECALIEHYGPTPKSLFVPIAEGKLIDPVIPYACHDCGRCEKVCPYVLPMRQVLMSIRGEYVKANNGKSPIKGHGGVRMHQRLSFSSLFSIKRQVKKNG